MATIHNQFPPTSFRIGRLLPTLSVSALLLVSPTACSKGSDQSGGASVSSRAAETSPVRDNAVLSYLPASALGFYLTDFSLESAKKFSGSPWSGSGTMVSDNVKKLVADDKGDSAQAVAFLEEFENEGLIPSPNAKGKLNTLLATFSIDEKATDQSLPGVAVYEDFVSQEQVAGRIAALEKKLAGRGVKTKPYSVEGGSGFTAEFEVGANEAKGSKPQKVSIIVAAKGSRLIASTVAGLINTEFLNGAPSTSTRYSEMKNDPMYQKALAAVPARSDEFAVSYLDTKRLLTTMTKLSPDMAKSQADIEKLPVGPGFMARAMNGALMDRGVLLLVGDAQKPNQGLDEIRKVSAGTYASQLPAGLVGFISLDGSVIRAIVKGMAEAEQNPEFKPMIDKALSIQEVGIALRPQQGASPLPEVLIALESSSAGELAKMISSTISAGVSGQGFLSPFQSKEVQGVSVQYAMSPFGAGVFVGSTDNQVIISTSENILSELITGSKDKKGLALQDLGNETKDILSAKDSLGLIHVNYTKVSSLVQGLSASLGIFTGGKPLVEEQELQRINSYGQTSASLSVVDDAIRFTTRTEAVPAPKA